MLRKQTDSMREANDVRCQSYDTFGATYDSTYIMYGTIGVPNDLRQQESNATAPLYDVRWKLNNTARESKSMLVRG